MIPVSIEALLLGAGPEKSVVVLRPYMETGPNPRVLPIYIGSSEAMAISVAIEGKKTERPQTHDLMLDLVDALGGRLVKVVIDRVYGMSFYSKLVMEQDGDEFDIDARPSDAIALAIRENAPIFVESPVFVATSINFNARRGDKLGEKELEAFHEFVENLNPSDFSVTPESEDTSEAKGSESSEQSE